MFLMEMLTIKEKPAFLCKKTIFSRALMPVDITVRLHVGTRCGFIFGKCLWWWWCGKYLKKYKFYKKSRTYFFIINSHI